MLFLGAVAIYCFMSHLHHSPCTKYEFARSHFLCTLIIRFQCKGWCDGVRLTLIAFFASIFCRRGHVQGYAIVHIFTFLNYFIWLLMFVQLCAHIEVNCCKRWGSDARRCPVARVAAMHSAFVHCALLQRCFVVKMHWSTVEEMH